MPSEAEEDALTEFVEQHATVVGKPRYPPKKLGEIEYLTGTRVYRVHSIVQHIPRFISLFGRQIKCIYTNKPETTDNYRRNPTYNDRNRIQKQKAKMIHTIIITMKTKTQT